MEVFFQEIFSILTTPPGNLTYHLVVIFSVVGALLTAINRWQASQYPQDKRMVIGLSLLLALRLVLILLAAISWQSLSDEFFPLPSVDRAVSLISLILIIWIWAFPEPFRKADSAALLLGLLVLVVSGLIIVWWSGQGRTLVYNGSFIDIFGGLFTIILILLGILILHLRKPNGWGFGMAMLSLLLIGSLAYLILPKSESYYSGIVRLAEMAAYPILLVLPQRFPLPPPTEDRTIKAPSPEQRRYAIDPNLLADLLTLVSESKQDKIYQSITRTIAQAMLADICLLASPPDDNGEMVFHCGYDLNREVSLQGFSLDSPSAPEIADALSKGLPLSLRASTFSLDQKNLSQHLNLNSTGHLLEAPVMTPDAKPIFGIFLLSPHSNRIWFNEDQALLSKITERLAYLLQHSEVLNVIQTELERTHRILQATQEEIYQIRQENEDLITQLQATRNVGGIDRSQAESLAALVISQEEAIQQIARLQAENEQLQRATMELGVVASSTSGSEIEQTQISHSGKEEHHDAALRMVLEEVAELKAELSEVDKQFLSLMSAMNVTSLPQEDTGELGTIVQELRRPLATIIGYTDFLLSESIGILGNLQHKFLERVKISTLRMSVLVDELGDVTVADRDGRNLISEFIDIIEVIDEAIEASQDQFREKSIVLRVDLPENLPQLFLNRVILGQALEILLANAGDVSPSEGEINLRARTQSAAEGLNFMLLQISDQGGGIPNEYLSTVFSRISHFNLQSIPGIGDKRTSLPIAKMLVENLGGRIWMDSQLNVGATYSILLPITRVSSSDSTAGVQTE